MNFQCRDHIDILSPLIYNLNYWNSNSTHCVLKINFKNHWVKLKLRIHVIAEWEGTNSHAWIEFVSRFLNAREFCQICKYEEIPFLVNRNFQVHHRGFRETVC